MPQVDVELASPLTIDGQSVTTLTFVREPIGSDLGRYTTMDLFEGNVKALAHVVPKITRPHISREVVLNMSTGNLTALSMGFAAFLEHLDVASMAKVKPTTSTSPSGGTAETASKPSSQKT
jgi:hypothetical protein